MTQSISTVNTHATTETNGNTVPVTKKRTVTPIDEANNFLFENMPDIAGNMMPEDYIQLASNKTMLRNESTEQSFKNLPRKSNGKIDIEQLKTARKYALDFIKNNNNRALQIFDSYGIYKEQLNNFNPVALAVGPEITAGLTRSGVIGDCASEYGVHDMSNLPGTLLEQIDADWTKDLADMQKIKSVQDIKRDINTQNAELDRLAKINLNTEEGIREFLQGYKNATGTAFSCNGILESINILQDNKKSQKDKLSATVKNYGIQYNYINAKKNEVATNTQYRVFTSTVSNIVSRFGFVGKAVGTSLPYVFEYVELGTKNCKDGQLINWDNYTFESCCDAATTATMTAFRCQATSGGFGGIFNKYTDTRLKRMGFSCGLTFSSPVIHSVGRKIASAAVEAGQEVYQASKLGMNGFITGNKIAHNFAKETTLFTIKAPLKVLSGDYKGALNDTRKLIKNTGDMAKQGGDLVKEGYNEVKNLCGKAWNSMISW